MLKKNLKKIIELGLRPTSERNLSLFLISCVALGYTEILKQEYGFSYEAVAVLGKADYIKTFFNQDF